MGCLGHKISTKKIMASGLGLYCLLRPVSPNNKAEYGTCIIIKYMCILFLYPCLKNGMCYVTVTGVHLSVNFFVSG